MTLDPDLTHAASFPSQSEGVAGLPPNQIVYPESDGEPMAENARQFNLIRYIANGLEAKFADDPNVWVTGNVFWYPVEGSPEVRRAPDVLVVFGRPKFPRPSYQQWTEENVAPQVVFEIWSPSNTAAEEMEKFEFYNRFGVEEYYTFDPATGLLVGWLRDGRAGRLQPISKMQNWLSPRLGVRFHTDPAHPFDDFKLSHADGSPFRTLAEADRVAEAALRETTKAQRREAAAKRREEEAKRHAAEANARAAEAERRAEEERSQRRRLEEQLRKLGIDPNTLGDEPKSSSS
ncbi:MAG TPA: Uma2 family endonuclease [Pirellulales bacterium]